jgi:hypothetical protein
MKSCFKVNLRGFRKAKMIWGVFVFMSSLIFTRPKVGAFLPSLPLSYIIKKRRAVRSLVARQFSKKILAHCQN